MSWASLGTSMDHMFVYQHSSSKLDLSPKFENLFGTNLIPATGLDFYLLPWPLSRSEFQSRRNKSGGRNAHTETPHLPPLSPRSLNSTAPAGSLCTGSSQPGTPLGAPFPLLSLEGRRGPCKALQARNTRAPVSAPALQVPLPGSAPLRRR